MLKVVVFDGGYGGEFFADKLADELPIIEIIRVIDWRHAEELLSNPRIARKIADEALRPYIGKVDLIIFANYLLTLTSLDYFRRKYKDQSFIGMSFNRPRALQKNTEVPILTTRAVAKTLKYQSYIFHLHFKAKTLTLDTWPAKIDDGELQNDEIRLALSPLFEKYHFNSIILACSQFYDLHSSLKRLYGPKLRIYDNFSDTIKNVNRALRIRGGVKKSKS
ncbi:hypothetical protein IKF92_02285 [Candidatus Saccharibacteria bacterium]|nr:hypothetical protein [Candidatus Saccharibacteria bacterium]